MLSYLNGWISVKDRLPDEEQDVLMLVEEIEVYGKHDERKHKWHNIFVGYCDDGNWLTSYCFGCEFISKVNDDFEARHDKSRVKVTHWMPLPELPKCEGGDEVRAPRLTETELERCRVYGAKWIYKSTGGQQPVFLCKTKPVIDANDFPEDDKSAEDIIASVWDETMFPSVHLGDCICVEEASGNA